jgi:hypothetical protein
MVNGALFGMLALPCLAVWICSILNVAEALSGLLGLLLLSGLILGAIIGNAIGKQIEKRPL